MKNASLLTIFAISLLSISPLASADNYPAAYFEPKVIYSAEGIKAEKAPEQPQKAAEKSDFDPRYPAANFQPKVIYSSEK